VPAPHAGDLALRELMKVNKLQHQDGFRVLRREGALDRLAQQIQEWLFARGPFGLGPAIEKIVGRIRGGGDLHAKALPPFQIDQAMRRDGEQPRFERASSLVFCQQRRAILFCGEAIRPKIGDQVFRFGLIRSPGAQDSDELPVVSTTQLRGRGSVHRQDALHEGQILLMTRSCFGRHKGKREWSSPFFASIDFDPGGSGRIDFASANREMSKRCNAGGNKNRIKPMAGISLSRPGPCVVGFTGHRRIENENKIAQVLRGVIASLQKEVGRDLIGRSSIASGADTLFAEACLAANMKWIAQLPFPEAEFKNDFSETDWKRARALLDRAERIQVSSESPERPRGYLDCGLATVEGADLMVAVWDGQAPRGLGGTAQIVEHARAVQKPLVLISPDGLEIKRERFSASESREDT